MSSCSECGLGLGDHRESCSQSPAQRCPHDVLDAADCYHCTPAQRSEPQKFRVEQVPGDYYRLHESGELEKIYFDKPYPYMLSDCWQRTPALARKALIKALKWDISWRIKLIKKIEVLDLSDVSES